MAQPAFNPYAPPEAAPPPFVTQKSDAGSYFTVSQVKLVVLTLMTLNFYLFYWTFKQWKAIKLRDGVDISPFWRTVFSVFYINSLFTDIRTNAVQANIPYGPSTATLSGMYIGAAILGNIGSRLDFTPLWFLSFLLVVPVSMIQKEANAVVLQSNPHADMNEQFTGLNILTMVVGLALWALVILGLVAG